MALQKEIWIEAIQEKLFANNDFINLALSHDSLVSNKTVHIPQSGTLPDIVKDRGSFPISISERTDTDLTYSLAVYDIGALRVGRVDDIQNSYDLLNSIMAHEINVLKDRVALEALISWSGTAAAQQILTTGTGTANIAPPGGTGNRKAITLADLGNVAKKLDKDNVPMDGRYIIMPSDMYWSFREENKAYVASSDFMRTANLELGIVGQVYGLNIVTRSATAAFTNASPAVVKAVGAATATTDAWGSIAFHRDYVCRAFDNIEVYMNENDALYKGDVLTAEVLFGSAKMRTDQLGIATLIQGQ